MDLTTWLSYVAIVAVLVITPGPSVLLTTANSMKYGTKKTLGTITGDLSANLCQIVLASLGLAAFVTSSGQVFQIIKWSGVGYLVYIGIRKIISKPATQFSDEEKPDRSFAKLLVEGFLMSAANPKAIVFFAAFLPLFIQPASAFFPQVVILAITFLILDGLALLVYSMFASQLKAHLEDNDKVYLQNKIVGALLILSGVMLSLIRKAQQ